jgi:hypothetical protein
VFKNYLTAQHDIHVLHAYHTALDISERFLELHQIPDPEVRESVFLHAVNGFYDRFVALGAEQRVSIPEGTHGDLMRRLANCTNIEHEVRCCVCFRAFRLRSPVSP